MNPQPKIESLHRVYGSLTGISVPLTMNRIYCWEAWTANGFSSEDLKLVVRHLQKKIVDRMRLMNAFRFDHLIGRTDYFEEDLSEARALARAPRTDYGKAEVLRATGRSAESTCHTERTAAQILAGMKAFEEFRHLKEVL